MSVEWSRSRSASGFIQGPGGRRLKVQGWTLCRSFRQILPAVLGVETGGPGTSCAWYFLGHLQKQNVNNEFLSLSKFILSTLDFVSSAMSSEDPAVWNFLSELSSCRLLLDELHDLLRGFPSEGQHVAVGPHQPVAGDLMERQGGLDFGRTAEVLEALWREKGSLNLCILCVSGGIVLRTWAITCGMVPGVVTRA